MKHLLDYKVKLNSKAEINSLYRWCLNEVSEDGLQISPNFDWIPFRFRLYFTTHSLKVFTSVRQSWETEGSLQIVKTISGEFISGWLDNNNELKDVVRFSIFGTKRPLEYFSVRISEVQKPDEEQCVLTVIPSYKREDELFREVVEKDYAGFDIHLSADKFAALVKVVEDGKVDSVSFSVKEVQGVYATWSPTIFTLDAKILTEYNDLTNTDASFEGTTAGKASEFSFTLKITTHLLPIRYPSATDDLELPYENRTENGSNEVQPDLITGSEGQNELLEVLKSIRVLLFVGLAILLVILIK